MNPIIEVKNLYKAFGNRAKEGVRLHQQGKSKDEIMREAGIPVGVADVSFEVQQGEILVIMGLSGSGKSTLVRCINRLIEPTAGEVRIDGTDILALGRHDLLQLRQKKFGMVFQNFALLPHRTVLHNVEFGLEIQKTDPVKMEQKAMEAINLVGLEGWEQSYPDQLSGGMQQRVGLARALAVDPDILLMDEAFSALDPLIRRDMQDELINLQERVQKTILFITHDLDEALKIGDRIILLKDGALVQEGTAEDILTNPATRYVQKFVEDVDLTKVLTARSVMKKPRAVAQYQDGPRVALRKMDEESISSLFALDKAHKLKGVVMAADAVDAAKRGEKILDHIINTDIIKVKLDTPVAEFFSDLATLQYPVAVVDDNDKLVGVIIRGSLLAGLAERGTVDNDNNS
ncbi:MAG: glycine betaine/L-proline ABC transporter ATP-binding protein [Desulfatibacillum sp.]|nr:glycine betaine/L-proline ABC transporter ATP-binding protein [Desulfatibacillum sp.]